MKKILLLAILLSPFFLAAQQVAKTLKAANGQTIGFYEFKPSDYGTQKHPLIIFLHGIAERGNGTTELPLITKVAIPKYLKLGRTMRFYVDGKWQSFVVLSPQLSKSYGGWQSFYVDEMIKYAVNNLKVDPNKITLTGLSLGGGGTWSYASSSSTNASKLAAIVPVCGTCGLSSAANIVNNKVAVYAFHGDQDNRVTSACSKNAISAITKLNPTKDALLKLYANTTTHVIWDRAYDTAYAWQKPNVWEWILRQSRGTTTTPIPTPIPLPNVPPVAKAGSDQTITLPANSVTLNGSASTDADGSISSYAWSKISGPSSFTISSASNVSTSVSNLVEGSYTFRLTVKDNDGASATNDLSITVNKAPVLGGNPVAKISGPASISLPTNSASLSGSNSSSPNGGIAKYRWDKISGPSSFSISGPNNRMTTLSSLVQGTYVIRLTVTDEKNATAYADYNLTVNGTSTQNPPEPSVVKSVISGLTAISLPLNSVALSGTNSSSPNGSISKYRWDKISGPSSFSISGPNNRLTTVSSLVQGTYVIRLTVTDNKGVTGSSEISITVNGTSGGGTGNTVQTVESVITGPSSTSNGSLELDGTESNSSNGSISSYRWTKVSGPSSYYIPGKNNRKTAIENLAAGTYVFRLTVTDSKGYSDQADKTVTVSGTTSTTKLSSGAVMETTPTQQTLVVSDKLSVYPNPAVSTINVQGSSVNTGSGFINIYDINGKIVKKTAFIKSQSVLQQTLDISTLSGGIYHLEMVIGSNPRMISKFVKQ